MFKLMKRFTKFFFAALALAFSANLAAQEEQQEVVYTSCGIDAKTGKMINFIFSAEGFQSEETTASMSLPVVTYTRSKQLYALESNATEQTLTVCDPEAFTTTSTVSGPLNTVTGLPVSAAASEQYPFGTFAIAKAEVAGVGTRYFTAVLDEKTAELKRISTVGYWYDDETKTSVAPLTFFFNYGTAYCVYAKRQGGVTKAYLAQLNIMTGELKETGAISAIENLDPEKAVACIYYLSTTYRNYLVVSPDGEQNSTIYYLPTFATNGEVAATAEATADRVLTGCYQRPSTITTYGNPTTPLAQPDDVKVEIDGTMITITFTIPTTDANGAELTPDEWALTNDYSRSINCSVYMENSSVNMSKPEGVSYFFPGDKATLTGDLSTVYGVTNPNGLHCFTVRVQPSNGYTGKALCDVGVFALVGGAKPEPVADAKVEMTGANSGLFTWTAPTATEYSDWGYAFDGSGLTYSIVRNIDGVVVADGLSGTSAEVDNLAKEPGDFDFSIYAVAGGTQSAAASTNSIFCQPPTYDFLGYNNTTGSITAFNVDANFTHTDWMTNANIGNEVGIVRGNKLLTTKYSYAKSQWSEYGSQTFAIFTAEKFEQQGYNFSNYWYANNGQVIRHLLTAAYDPQLDRVFGVAVDTVRNANAEPVELKYYVVDVDTVGSYQAQNRIVDVLGRWSLADTNKDAKAVLAVAAFDKQFYAAVANRQDGEVSYELCTFNPMTQELATIAPISLPIGLDYGFQFFVSTADKLYLGYNNGTDNTALYEISVADAKLTKLFDMDGQYTYAYQKPSTVAQPAQTLATIVAPTVALGTGEVKDAITVTVPASDTNGNALSDDTSISISVLKDGQQIATTSGHTPGNVIEIGGLEIGDGLHLLTIEAAPADPAIGASRVAVSVVVGPAKPNAPTNAVAEMFGDNEAQIEWKAPTTSIWADWGATITAEDVLTYIVEQNQDQLTLVSDCPDQEFYAEKVADWGGMYDFTVYAVNGTQVSEGTVTNLVEVIGELKPVGIDAVKGAQTTTTAIYNQAGVLTNRLQPGVNIIRRADGKTVKVIMTK